jgi:hypothetical protein
MAESEAIQRIDLKAHLVPTVFDRHNFILLSLQQQQGTAPSNGQMRTASHPDTFCTSEADVNTSFFPFA